MKRVETSLAVGAALIISLAGSTAAQATKGHHGGKVCKKVTTHHKGYAHKTVYGYKTVHKKVTGYKTRKVPTTYNHTSMKLVWRTKTYTKPSYVWTTKTVNKTYTVRHKKPVYKTKRVYKTVKVPYTTYKTVKVGGGHGHLFHAKHGGHHGKAVASAPTIKRVKVKAYRTVKKPMHVRVKSWAYVDRVVTKPVKVKSKSLVHKTYTKKYPSWEKVTVAKRGYKHVKVPYTKVVPMKVKTKRTVRVPTTHAKTRLVCRSAPVVHRAKSHGHHKKSHH